MPGFVGRRVLRERVRAVARVLAVVLSPCLFLAVAEGVSRQVGPAIPAWQTPDSGAIVMVGHPTRLWGVGTGVRMNGGVNATVNSLGFRGPLPETPRPPGRSRILILGDSTFFGHGVRDRDTMAVQLEERLQARGLEVDVVNGGIPGYSTEQTRLFLDEVGYGLEPTLLLIGNLWSDNNYDHYRDADLLRTRSVADDVLSQSAFYLLLSGWIDRAKGGRGARMVTWTTGSAWATEGIRRVPVQDYARNLDSMAREAAKRGIGAAFIAPVNRPMAEAVDTDLPNWAPYFTAQAAVAANLGAPLVDTRTAMEDATAMWGADDLFVDEMHPTRLGHGILADLVLEALLGAGWPADPLLADGPALDVSGLRDTPDEEADRSIPSSPQANLFPGMAPQRAP